MNNNIKAAVIGSTGKSGKYLLPILLQNGFACRILLREPLKLAHLSNAVEIVQGDARNYGDVNNLLKGCNVVISTLGQPTGEPPIFSAAAKNVILAMQQHNITRYIATTGLSVNAPGDKKGPAATFGTEWMYKNYPATTADKQAELNELLQSGIDWTLIRLPLIEQTDDAPKTFVSLQDCPGSNISATSLAHFIIEQVGNTTYSRNAPFIANK